MISGIDHVVILVDQLDEAIATYQSLGFTVTPGGRHPKGTHNALVCFQDGSYFELIAFWEETDESHSFHRHRAAGPGIIAFALAAKDLEATIAELRSRGLQFSDAHPGARERPDGVEIAWRMSFPEGGVGVLPFLIEDVTDRELRVPGGQAIVHANGVNGIARLSVVVEALATTTSQYAALLASPEPLQTEAWFDQPSRVVELRAGAHVIELHAPLGDGPMAGRLTTRGAGPYAVVLNGPSSREIQSRDSGGARLRITASENSAA